jgi:hypothetical protein
MATYNKAAIIDGIKLALHQRAASGALNSEMDFLAGACMALAIAFQGEVGDNDIPTHLVLMPMSGRSNLPDDLALKVSMANIEHWRAMIGDYNEHRADEENEKLRNALRSMRSMIDELI